jgi:hypothetical protein
VNTSRGEEKLTYSIVSNGYKQIITFLESSKMTSIMKIISGKLERTNVKQSQLPILEHVTISVSLCKKLFADRHDNRDLVKNSVIKLKREMQLGNWRPGASLVHFDKQGNNIDGQHRLAAAIEANMPLKTMVAFGSTIEDMMVFDTGKERKAKDRKKINKLDISQSAMITLRFACTSKGALGQMPSTVEDKLYEKYGEVAEFVCSRLPAGGAMGQTAMKLALIKAYYHFGEDVVERFINVINSGLPDASLGLQAKDPAFRLREWLFAKSTEVRKRREVLAKSIKATELFSKGRGVQYLKAVTDVNVYPLPDEDIYIPKPEGLKVIG